MPATAEIYFVEIPNATTKTEKSLKMTMKTRKLTRELRKKTHMLKSNSRVGKIDLWFTDIFADRGIQ